MGNQELPLHLVCLPGIQHNLLHGETFSKDPQTNRVCNHLYNMVERTHYPFLGVQLIFLWAEDCSLPMVLIYNGN